MSMKTISLTETSPYSPAKTPAKPLATLEIVKNQANPFSANCTVWEGKSSWLGDNFCSLYWRRYTRVVLLVCDAVVRICSCLYSFLAGRSWYRAGTEQLDQEKLAYGSPRTYRAA